MFGTLTNLVKAAAAVVITPAALAVDLVTLPASAFDIDREPLGRTAAMLNAVGDCVEAALEPEKS